MMIVVITQMYVAIYFHEPPLLDISLDYIVHPALRHFKRELIAKAFYFLFCLLV